MPRARPVPPEVPDWRAAGAGSSSAAFQSSLGTPPSVGVAPAEEGRRERAGPGHSSARGARRCRAAGCKLCAALQELRDPGALRSHRTTLPGCCRRFQSSTRKAAQGTLLPLSRPPPPPLAERRSAEGRGLLHTDAHLPAPCTPELRCRAEVRLPKWRWSHNCRCTEERERLEQTPPNSMLLDEGPGNAQDKSPSGSPHLKHTRSAFLRLSRLLPLSFAGCENGPRDSELWQRFQRVTWGRGAAVRGWGKERERAT